MLYIFNYNIKEGRMQEFQKFIKKTRRKLSSTLQKAGSSRGHTSTFLALAHIMLPTSGNALITLILKLGESMMTRPGSNCGIKQWIYALMTLSALGYCVKLTTQRFSNRERNHKLILSLNFPFFFRRYFCVQAYLFPTS